MSDYFENNNDIVITNGDDLLPNYPLKNSRYKLTEEYIVYPSEPTEEKKEHERKKLEIRNKNFSEGVDIFKDFQYLDIFDLMPDDTGWHYFEKPDPMQYLNLTSSIQTIGLFNPLIVQKNSDGKFNIICGHSRAGALKDIYKNTHNERYRQAPCFILGDDVDEYYIRCLMIDSNLIYRTISRDTYMKAIFERHELLERTKKHRNEINIAQAIADEFGVSKATINNYLTLKHLCKEAMTLVYKKELKLSCAQQLAKFKHEDQLYILEHTSLENLNEQFKMRILTKNINLENPSEKDLNRKIETLNRIVPSTTPIKIDMSKDCLERYLKSLIDFRRVELESFSTTEARKYIKKTINVTLKESDMKLYLEKGIISEELVKKVCSNDYMEIMRE